MTVQESVDLFYILYSCTAGSVVASMVAYVAAQFFDIRIFHFLKEKTKGKALWLRNNGSTLVSQGIDSFAVIFITFSGRLFNDGMEMKQFFILFGSNYLFKMTVALLDTLPFYFLVYRLRRYLRIADSVN